MSTTTDHPPAEFTETITSLMKRRAFGQRDLATLAGVDESLVSRFMRGLQTPSLSTAAALIHVFVEEDQRILVIAYLRDLLREMGFQPEQFSIRTGDAPTLADLAGPLLAETVATLLQRSRDNPGIAVALGAMKKISEPPPANPARRLELSRKILPPKKTITRRKAAG